MLVPAILYKDEIMKGFQTYYYSNDMMYIVGSLSNWFPRMDEEEISGRHQYAIVDSDKKLLGYMEYFVDWYNDSATQFGLLSFDRGNIIVGRDVYNKLEELVNRHHRVSWRMIGGNKIEKHYDKFCFTHNGTKHILKDAVRDKNGMYHNDIIYEIVK